MKILGKQGEKSQTFMQEISPLNRLIKFHKNQIKLYYIRTQTCIINEHARISHSVACDCKSITWLDGMSLDKI